MDKKWKDLDPTKQNKPILVCPQCEGKYIQTEKDQKVCLFCKNGKIQKLTANIDEKYDEYVPFMKKE
jgi:hypothetical protein